MDSMWASSPLPLERTLIACGKYRAPSLASEQIGFAQQYVPLNNVGHRGYLGLRRVDGPILLSEKGGVDSQ